MSSLTPNYNPNPLAPKIIISDSSDVEQFRFEPKSNYPSPTQTLGKVTDLSLELGINDNFGKLDFTIDDHGQDLTDSSSLAKCLVKRQHKVQLYLGKTAATEQRWFYGKIFDTNVLRPGTNQQSIYVQCVGWGVTLRERATRIIRNQPKLSDGITLDTTDVTTKAYQLIKDVIEKQDHYLDSNIPILSGITDTGVCTDCLDFNIANVNETYNTFAGTINKLSSTANTIWGVDWDRDLFVRDPHAHDSGFLFTNDLSSTDAQNWTDTKIAYLIKAPIAWTESSYDGLYSIFHFTGPFYSKLDQSYTTTPDATATIYNKWLSIPFTPTVDNLAKIAIRMNRTGTPPVEMEVQIRGDDGASKPDPTDIRQSVKISRYKLQALGTSTPSNWLEIPITPRIDITPNEKLYIVIKMLGDASNTVNVDYKSGSGTYQDSTDGITWTDRTGNFNFRNYSALRMLMTVEVPDVVQGDGGIRERIFPVRADAEIDTVKEAALTVASTLARERRSYQDMVISCPTDRIPLGKFCYIKDAFTGLNIKANIIGVKLNMTAGRENPDNLGATQITLQLDDYYK